MGPEDIQALQDLFSHERSDLHGEAGDKTIDHEQLLPQGKETQGGSSFPTGEDGELPEMQRGGFNPGRASPQKRLEGRDSPQLATLAEGIRGSWGESGHWVCMGYWGSSERIFLRVTGSHIKGDAGCLFLLSNARSTFGDKGPAMLLPTGISPGNTKRQTEA